MLMIIIEKYKETQKLNNTYKAYTYSLYACYKKKKKKKIYKFSSSKIINKSRSVAIIK